ncbi:MAG: hypothetical protein ABI857_03480 [Acidobacteriota bacterium]
MIDLVAVDEIIRQYAEHGWTLRRALLSHERGRTLANILGDVEVEHSDFDALWFTRRSRPDSEAWELRRLTALPFALIAVIPDHTSADEVDATLSQVVEEMRSKTIA